MSFKNLFKYKITPICAIKVRSFVNIPKWFVSLWAIFVVLLCVLFFATLIVIYLSPRRARYLEHCINRLCAEDTNLQCINGICQCGDNGYYYSNKCYTKKTYLQNCENCTSNLICMNKICQCKSTQYWDSKNNKCKELKSYLDTCSSNECSSKALLYCNSTSGVCQCDKTSYWDGVTCQKKKIGDQKCLTSAECDDSLSLSCSCSSKTENCIYKHKIFKKFFTYNLKLINVCVLIN